MNLLHTRRIIVNGIATMENSLVVPQEVKHKIIICPAIPPLCTYSKELKRGVKLILLLSKAFFTKA